MKILILNWRDIKHPAAGGAEVVTFEVAKRWVQCGHEVTWFAAGFQNGLTEEKLEGIEIIRRGKQFTVHYEAFRYYQQHWRGHFDVVIDEINTIPFFTPLYVREKKVAYFHQLAREVWFYETPFPLNLLGFLLEPLYLRFYRRTPIITISESTQEDLANLGVEKIYIVHDGVDVTPLPEVPKPGEKAQNPTVLYVGRVVPSKRVADIIKAIYLVSKKVPDVQLWIAGSSNPAYLARLKRQIQQYQLDKQVHFLGKISFEERQALMKQAHLLSMASVREGWGLVVIEANAMGTPAVVYKVPGLVDSVRDGRTGLVCQQNTPQNLADQIIHGLLDNILREKLAEGALEWSRQFTWQTNAKGFLDILEAVDD
jgi:glycosyltransferase involved in cell wall biosynthesis